MDRDTLVHRLAVIIAGDVSLLLDGWTHLVLVSVVEAGTPDMTGFCYAQSGRATPVAPSDFEIFDVLVQLRRAMAEADGKGPWVAALIRVERATGRFGVEFEHEDAGRWAVTPQNVQQRAAELAPG